MKRPPRMDRSSFRQHPEFVLEPVADALLPWGDPYIIKLAQQLEREAREQIEAAFEEEAEAALDDEFYGDPDEPFHARFPRRREFDDHPRYEPNAEWRVGATKGR